jgi:hypothetical protein
MQKMCEVLDHESDNIAGIYAGRAGGTAKQWRKAMLEETWYNAAEAVEAGLADKQASNSRAADPAASLARWDLSVFGYRHNGRDAAPDPNSVPAVPRAVAAVTPPNVTAPVTDPPAPPEPEPAPPPDGEVVMSGSPGSPTASAHPNRDREIEFAPGLLTSIIENAAMDAPWPTDPPATAEAPDLTDAELGDVIATSIRKAFQ